MKQAEDNKTLDIEDIIVWPDGTQAYRYELDEYSYMSDDYVVYYFGSPEWVTAFYGDKPNPNL